MGIVVANGEFPGRQLDAASVGPVRIQAAYFFEYDWRDIDDAVEALRLGKWFGTSPAFWLNLQKSYELRKAVREIGKEIDAIPTRAKESV